MEDSPETITWFANADIAVLRSGKAKKNDPPIPADLAPISGSGQKVQRTEQQTDGAVLESVKFRYSTETVVEEKPEPAQEQENKARRNRKPKAKTENPRPEQVPEQENEIPDAGEEQAKKSRRRPNYRRRPNKPKQGGEG